MKEFEVRIIDTKTMQVVSILNLNSEDVNAYEKTELQEYEVIEF